MDDVPDVGLIYPHAEGIGRNEDRVAVLQETSLGSGLLLSGETTMVFANLNPMLG